MSGGTGRILKKGSADPGAAIPRVVEGAVLEARARASQIIAEAEAQAAAVRANADADAGRTLSSAREQGHADGLAQAAASMALAAQVREAKLAELDRAVVDVALEVARRVLGRELETSPQAVLDVARRALRAAAGAGDIVLRICPGDLPTVREAAGPLSTLVLQGSLAIVEDPGLQRGEVVVEAPGGRVDARIGAQLEAFRRALQSEER
jgi:flagellar biosynthesis/type III secretory pathway protein FliH